MQKTCTRYATWMPPNSRGKQMAVEEVRWRICSTIFILENKAITCIHLDCTPGPLLLYRAFVLVEGTGATFLYLLRRTPFITTYFNFLFGSDWYQTVLQRLVNSLKVLFNEVSLDIIFNFFKEINVSRTVAWVSFGCFDLPFSEHHK